MAHKPYIDTSTDHFTLVLPDLTYEEGLSDDSLPHISFVPAENAADKDEKVLRFCYPKARKVSEIARFLTVADSTYLRKNILKRLVDQHYLICDKVSGTNFYKTNPEVVKVE